MTRTKSSRALVSVVLAVLMAVAFMPAISYTSFAATAKKATKVTKVYHKANTTYTRTVGSAWTLKYKLSPSKLTTAAKKVVWKSSNKSVVSVSAKSGNKAAVSFKKAGTATVTVYTKANKKAKTSWKFKVVNAASKTTTLTGVTVSAPNAKDPASEVKVGTTLKANVAPEDAAGVTYQWYADGTEIAGATSSEFTVTTDQIGKAITVKAASKNTVESTATAKVTGVDVKVIDTKTVNPKATGDADKYAASVTTKLGDTEAIVLYADAQKTTTVDSSVATYQWYRVGGSDVNGNAVSTAISGATNSTYTITSDDLGYTIKCVVTPKTGVTTTSVGRDANGKTFTKTFGTVSATISGVSVQANGKDVNTAVTGTQLTAVTEPAGAASVVNYQWKLNGTKIEGATSATYTPTVAGNYSVEITIPSTENTWKFTSSAKKTASVVVSNKATKQIAINTAYNTNIKYDENTGVPQRTKNYVTDTLKVTAKDEANSKPSYAWYLKGVKDAKGNDVQVGNAQEYKIGATIATVKKANGKAVEKSDFVGNSVYAVVTGGTGDYAGTTATSKEFAVSAQDSTISSPTISFVGTGAPISASNVTISNDGTNNITFDAVSVSKSASDRYKVTVSFNVPAGAVVTCDGADSPIVNATTATITKTITNTSNFTFTVDQDGDGTDYAPTTYTVDMSKVTLTIA